jgi:bifunctional DNase/RNase
MLIQVELHQIIIREMEKEQVIVLKEVDGPRRLPIMIGTNEALAIDRRLKGMMAPRPLTHDLLATVIEALGGKLERIEIPRFENHTYFARLLIRHQDKVIEVDSRPSDAVAIGIGSGVPIFVAAEIMDFAAS